MTLKLNGSSAGSVAIDAPADTSPSGTDVTLTLPTSAGSSGQYLQTNGSGTLSWQTVAGLPDAIDVNASAPADTLNIDSSGRLLHEHTSAITNLKFGGSGDFGSRSYVIGANQGFGNGLAILNYDATASIPAILKLGTSRSDTPGTNTVVGSSNDTCVSIQMMGNDGTRFIDLARIDARVDGTPGTNDMPGRLEFSTCKDGASVVTERMQIAQEGQTRIFSDDDCFHAQSGRSAGIGYACIYARHSATGTRSGTASFLVYTNGNVLNTNNSYGSLSDIKLKENIVDAGSQWDDLKAIQVRKYNFKAETKQQTHTQLGVIAQEVELVSPGLVTESPDRDAEGNDLGTTTKSVNYSVLYMKAVKALQEAMTRIEALETANASLEARLTALEGGAS